jgi:hypothetical protein
VPIVPVLAIGGGEVSHVALQHAADLREARADVRPEEAGQVEPTEIWLLREDGNIDSQR